MKNALVFKMLLLLFIVTDPALAGQNNGFFHLTDDCKIGTYDAPIESLIKNLDDRVFECVTSSKSLHESFWASEGLAALVTFIDNYKDRSCFQIISNFFWNSQESQLLKHNEHLFDALNRIKHLIKTHSHDLNTLLNNNYIIELLSIDENTSLSNNDNYADIIFEQKKNFIYKSFIKDETNEFDEKHFIKNFNYMKNIYDNSYIFFADDQKIKTLATIIQVHDRFNTLLQQHYKMIALAWARYSHIKNIYGTNLNADELLPRFILMSIKEDIIGMNKLSDIVNISHFSGDEEINLSKNDFEDQCIIRANIKHLTGLIGNIQTDLIYSDKSSYILNTYKAALVYIINNLLVPLRTL